MNRPRAAVIGALAVLLLLAGCSAVNPALNVPLVSPLVCSVKGGDWYGGGFWGPPGCYARP